MWWDNDEKMWRDHDEDFDCAYPYPCDCPACEAVAERLLEEKQEEAELAEREHNLYMDRLAEEVERLAEERRRRLTEKEERLAKEKAALYKDLMQVGRLAQRLAGRMRLVGEPSTKAPFPTGEISRLGHDEQRWPYITDDEEQRTLRCMRMVCDLNEWNRKIWALRSTAAEAWEWQISLPLIFIMEFLITRYAQKNGWTMVTKNGRTIKPERFESATNICFTNGVYDEQLRDLLHEARDWRNETHLSRRARVGYEHDGSFDRYVRIQDTLDRLEKALEWHWQYKARSL